MSVSDNERTFVPAELDVLEDSLELPADAMPRLSAEFDDDARARIHGALIRYRAIERHSQALLREHEPPASVLASVLAEARAAAASPVVGAPVPARPSGWSRLRALWYLPSIAAVAGAAIVAVMITRPESSQTAAGPSEPPRVARAEPPAMSAPGSAVAPPLPPLADASTLPRDGNGSTRGDALVTEIAAAEREAPAESAAPRGRPAEPSAPDVELGFDKDDRVARREKKAKGAAGSTPSPIAPGGIPAPKSPAKPSTKNDEAPRAPAPPTTTVDDRLSRADDARRRGDCEAARPDYQGVITSGSAKQRARARAGLALCLERAGQREAARELVEQARADDAAIDAWISTER